MNVAVDHRPLRIESPIRQASVRLYVGAFHGFEKDAVITADGIDMIAIHRRLETAAWRSEIGDALPRTQAAVGSDGGAFHRGAGDVVLPAAAAGAADGVDIIVENGGGQIEAGFA